MFQVLGSSAFTFPQAADICILQGAENCGLSTVKQLLAYLTDKTKGTHFQSSSDL